MSRWDEIYPALAGLHRLADANNVAAERLYARHGLAPTGRRERRERDGLVEVELAVELST